MNGPAASEARGAADAPPVHGGSARSLPAARMRLHVDQVVIGVRLRPLNPAKVQALIVSHEETGALPPILTRPYNLTGERPIVMLVAGLHRLQACRVLNVPVDAMVRDMTDAEALLTEVDENLLGPDLSPLDRAVFIAARLRAWAQKYPDRVKADGDTLKPKRGRPANSAKFAEFQTGMGFTEETAAEIGLSKRSVEQALATFQGLSTDTRAALPGTWIARNEGALRQLAGVADEGEQARVLAVLLKGETKSVSDAIAMAAGRTPVRAAPTPDDVWLDGLSKAFKGGTPAQKAAFLHWLSGQPLPADYRVLKGKVDG